MKRFPILALLLLSSAPKMAAQQSLDSILFAVERNNLELKSLQQQLTADVLDVKSQNALSGPTVEYSPFYQKGYTGMAESELVVTQEFDFPTRYAQHSRQVGLAETAGERRYRSARKQVLLEATLCYLDIVHSNRTLALLRQRQQDSDDVLRLLQERMNAGDANALEINKAKMDRMDAMALCSKAEGERVQQLGRLRLLNGGEDLEVTDSLFPAFRLDKDCETYVRERLQTDADVLAAEAILVQAEHELSMSRTAWLPNLSVGYRRNTERGEAVNGFLVGASFPLMGSKNKVRAARMRQQSAQTDVIQLRHETETQLRALYKELLALHETVNRFDTNLMEESLGLLTKALQMGQITTLQYYTEVGEIYDKLLSQIELEHQAAKVYARMFSE